MSEEIFNRAAFLTLHQSHNCPAAKKSRGQINVDDCLPVVQRKLFDFVSMQAAAGNIDEDIDAAVIRDDFLKSFLHVGFPGHIKSYERCLFSATADFGCDLLSTLLVYIENHYGQIVRARRSTTACPIPDAPPVTTATLFIATPYQGFCILFLTPTSSAKPASRELLLNYPYGIAHLISLDTSREFLLCRTEYQSD